MVLAMTPTWHASALRDSERQFHVSECKDHSDDVSSSVGALGSIELNARPRRGSALIKDVLLTREGSLQLKPHLWKDIRAVILRWLEWLEWDT